MCLDRLFIIIIALLASVWIAPAPAQAKVYYLNPEPNLDGNFRYRDELLDIKKGDIVRFSDGRRFTIQGALGEGGTTRVFDIGNGRALRLPSSAANCCKWNQYILDNGPILDRAGVPVPQVYVEESSKLGHYVVVEKVQVRTTLADALSDLSRGRMTLAEFEQYVPSLVEFARSTASLSYISDFKPAQLGWTGQKWVLLDWANAPHFAVSMKEVTVFERSPAFNRLPGDLKKILIQAVHEKRATESLGATLPPGFRPPGPTSGSETTDVHSGEHCVTDSLEEITLRGW